MDEERKKQKRLVMILFLGCLCAALACFGIFGYFALIRRNGGTVGERTVTIVKIFVMTGILFLALAFGYLLPILISHQKRSKGEFHMSDMFDEASMRQALGRHIPDGETLLAGIHAVAKETSVSAVFAACTRTETSLVPDENGGAVALEKKKYSTYDIYIGITQHFLVMAECEQNSYYYQFDDAPAAAGGQAQNVTAPILFSDIGTCFPVTDIQSCTIKKGWMGSVNCHITMKNGSYFKLMFPKMGGLGGGMPRHAQYREAIIARLAAAAPAV